MRLMRLQQKQKKRHVWQVSIYPYFFRLKFEFINFSLKNLLELLPI